MFFFLVFFPSWKLNQKQSFRSESAKLFLNILRSNTPRSWEKHGTLSGQFLYLFLRTPTSAQVLVIWFQQNGSKNANKCVTSRSWIYSLYIQYYKLFRVCVHARACGRKERRFRSLLKLLVILQWHSICPYNVGQKCGTIIPCSHAQIQDQLNIVVRNMHGMALLRPQNILPHTMTPSSRTHMRKRDSRVIKI